MVNYSRAAGGFMAFLPIEKIIYETDFTRDEIISCINNTIEPRGVFGIYKKNSYGKPYEGELHNNEFNINRITAYRNSFLPVVKGIIAETGNDKTNVIIKMRPALFVVVFMSIWLGAAFLISAAALIPVLLKKEFNLTFLISFAMALFGYLLMTCAFKFEANKTRKYFNELFKGGHDQAS
jgi:hypothetical protein